MNIDFPFSEPLLSSLSCAQSHGGSGLAGKLLRALHFGGDILVLSIHRENQVLVPHGDTRLELGDCLTVLGDKESVRELTTRLE